MTPVRSVGGPTRAGPIPRPTARGACDSRVGSARFGPQPTTWLQFHLAWARPKPAPDDQGEDVGVDPRGRSSVAAFAELADAAGQPAGLAALVAALVVSEPAAAHRDLAHAQLAVGDLALDGLA